MAETMMPANCRDLLETASNSLTLNQIISYNFNS
jgi:hypothetical protein